jgi:AraC-like DNA-binding protein/mannose-6-phosphate isomerase-like protein (cupin superfamily)
MKASLEQLDSRDDSSFQIKEVIQNRFDAPYHYHPAFELTLIISGEGKRFVGNNITDFHAGDLVLLGANLPHCWQNHRQDWLTTEENTQKAQALVIHFKPDFLGSDFFSKPECRSIKQLLEKARGGFSIQGPTQDRVIREMLALKDLNPFARLISLLNILHAISNSGTDTQAIDTNEVNYQLSSTDLDRINRIYAYVIANYTQEVHLDEVAHLANMTETAFCRFFKKVTKKTFVSLVTEFRIKHACELLRTSNKPMAEICFESGFGNLSHFNKQFKQYMNETPLQYRKLVREWEVG